jgi:serine protease Do
MLAIRSLPRLILASFFLAFAAVPAGAYNLPPSFADMVEKLSPAVVNVSTTQKAKASSGNQMMMPFQDLPDTPEFEPFRQFFDQLNRGQHEEEHDVYSLGSGFIIDASGFIITNAHVIDDAEEVSVTLSDNSKYKAKIIGRDKKTDLALLKVEAKKPLPFVTLGDSDAVRVGDWVIAIGNPYGLGGSVTQGIISARERSLNAGPFDDFLQTDASINRGNSGGPLFNEKGEVIGINTAIFSPSGGSIGIGFAVPSAVAKPVVAQLKEYGRTHRGWLGVKIQEVSEEAAESVGLPKPVGALVLDVGKDSPADKAGIKVGDVITAYDGKEIAEMRFLPRMVAETKIGKTVSVTYWHNNASKTVDITIGELNEKEEEAENAEDGHGKKYKNKGPESQSMLGMELSPLTTPLREELGLEAAQTGVAVTGVKGGSVADKNGVRPGDVILDINGAATKTVEDVKKGFATVHSAGRKFALVKILREKETAFITLPTEEPKNKKDKE